MRAEPWNDERIDLLKKLWAEGATAAAIAAKLGGISRSAILGKIFRLRLPPGAAGKKPGAQASAPGTAKAMARAPLARRRGAGAPENPPNAKTGRKGRTLFELTNDCCRWPYRRPGTAKYFFCGAAGADLEGGIPYCVRHMKRAYLVPPPRIVETRRKSRSWRTNQDGERRMTKPDSALAERAARAARAELRGEREGILGAIGQAAPVPLLRARTVPDRWSFLFVMERLEEGFRILSRLPMPTRPRGYINSMPIYLYDRGDLNSQLETYELERMARMRNRVRIPPSPAEIARMEEALHWPSAFLSGPEFQYVARAVNLGSLWAAFDVDIGQAVKRIKQYAAYLQRPQASGLAHHRGRADPPPRAGALAGGLPCPKDWQARSAIWSKPIGRDWGRAPPRGFPPTGFAATPCWSPPALTPRSNACSAPAN